MYNLTSQLIRSVCTKCQLSSICDTLRKWGRLSEEQLQYIFDNRAKTKEKMTRSILNLVHNQEEVELTTEIAGDLELSYIQLHSKKKLWKVFKLTGGALDFHQDPRILRSRLTQELQKRWKDGIIYGNMGCYSGAVWLRIHFDASNRRRKKSSNASRTQQEEYNPNNSVFVLHFQGSPYLIMSNTRVKQTALLTQALVKVFSAESLNYMQLSDRHVFSLADIVLKKNHETQKVHGLRELDAKENPFSRSDRKRKKADDILQDTDAIKDENKAEKRVRYTHVDKMFGPDPQPALEKLEYKFSIQGREDIGVCKTEIVIKGTSVLSGLKQLANKGFMKFPLPRHLTSVLADQRNSFSVVSSRSKSKAGK